MNSPCFLNCRHLAMCSKTFSKYSFYRRENSFNRPSFSLIIFLFLSIIADFFQLSYTFLSVWGSFCRANWLYTSLYSTMSYITRTIFGERLLFLKAVKLFVQHSTFFRYVEEQGGNITQLQLSDFK